MDDILSDWYLNWTAGLGSDSDRSQPDVKLTESELHALPEIGSEVRSRLIGWPHRVYTQTNSSLLTLMNT